MEEEEAEEERLRHMEQKSFKAEDDEGMSIKTGGKVGFTFPSFQAISTIVR